MHEIQCYDSSKDSAGNEYIMMGSYLVVKGSANKGKE